MACRARGVGIVLRLGLEFRHVPVGLVANVHALLRQVSQSTVEVGLLFEREAREDKLFLQGEALVLDADFALHEVHVADRALEVQAVQGVEVVFDLVLPELAFFFYGCDFSWVPDLPHGTQEQVWGDSA